MRKKINVIVTISTVYAIFFVFAVFAQKSEAEKCKDFVAGYGWIVAEKYVEAVDIKIPEIFDEVYKSYNKIQSEAGLNIEQYRGMAAVRYTYELLNYPYDVGEPVYINIVCVGGEPVAGDIMTVSVNGFMHSLKLSK